MPAKTEPAWPTIRDTNRALAQAVKATTTPAEIDEAFTKLYGAQRDLLALLHWRCLIAEKQAAVIAPQPETASPNA